ncbi:nucleotide exchange factor GrpE [Streptomyces vietnamensis]|uniref:nucleotide exchange factor GrpE n=1 Tax=Streptomyces vietnamensis TaxID=362257 RepID=UPI0007C80723|nr:nucleotide exchange factor GrpE [Streptomyces vietnamensis]
MKDETREPEVPMRDTAGYGGAEDQAREHGLRPGPAAAGSGEVRRSPEDAAGSGEVRPGSEDADGSGVPPVLPELDVEELHDRWQRAVAETENQRKRHERQLEEVRLAERDRVSEAWLPVVDHLELALQHAAADPEAIIAGVEGVCRQAYAVLARLGYQRIAAVGEPFDPALHDAAQVRQDPQAAPGTVVQVLRAGYGSDRGLLRPATVAVQAGPDEREARS